MPLSIPCPYCGRPHAVRGEQAGFRVRCKRCGEPFTLADDEPEVRRPRARNRRRERALLWVYRVGASLVLVGALAYFLVHLSRRLELFAPVVTRTNYDKLQLGMPESGVRAILGRPDQVDEKILELTVRYAREVKVNPDDCVRRCFWRKGQDVIWADILSRRVVGCGATLGGQEFSRLPPPPPPDTGD